MYRWKCSFLVEWLVVGKRRTIKKPRRVSIRPRRGDDVTRCACMDSRKSVPKAEFELTLKEFYHKKTIQSGTRAIMIVSKEEEGQYLYCKRIETYRWRSSFYLRSQRFVLPFIWFITEEVTVKQEAMNRDQVPAWQLTASKNQAQEYIPPWELCHFLVCFQGLLKSWKVSDPHHPLIPEASHGKTNSYFLKNKSHTAVIHKQPRDEKPVWVELSSGIKNQHRWQSQAKSGLWNKSGYSHQYAQQTNKKTKRWQSGQCLPGVISSRKMEHQFPEKGTSSKNVTLNHMLVTTLRFHGKQRRNCKTEATWHQKPRFLLHLHPGNAAFTWGFRDVPAVTNSEHGAVPLLLASLGKGIGFSSSVQAWPQHGSGFLPAKWCGLWFPPPEDLSQCAAQPWEFF